MDEKGELLAIWICIARHIMKSVKYEMKQVKCHFWSGLQGTPNFFLTRWHFWPIEKCRINKICNLKAHYCILSLKLMWGNKFNLQSCLLLWQKYQQKHQLHPLMSTTLSNFSLELCLGANFFRVVIAGGRVEKMLHEPIFEKKIRIWKSIRERQSLKTSDI